MTRLVAAVVAVVTLGLIGSSSAVTTPAVPAEALSANAAATPTATGVVDDFTGPRGTSPSRARWTFEQGGNGWGNAQQQQYTDRPVNAQLNGNGVLAITAQGETYTGVDKITRSYTSARLTSTGTVTYGTVSARIKLTGAPGAFPAFWLRGADRATVGWPVCGEIDIMEALNDLSTLYVTAHGPFTDGRTTTSWSHGGQRSPAGGLAGAWHTYSMTWTRNAVSWALDGVSFRTIGRNSLSDVERWTLDHPMNVILDVAVGGWAGTPAPAAQFRASMLVDWVRFRPLAG